MTENHTGPTTRHRVALKRSDAHRLLDMLPDDKHEYHIQFMSDNSVVFSLRKRTTGEEWLYRDHQPTGAA